MANHMFLNFAKVPLEILKKYSWKLSSPVLTILCSLTTPVVLRNYWKLSWRFGIWLHPTMQKEENTKLKYAITQLQVTGAGNISATTVDIPAPTTTCDTFGISMNTTRSNPDNPVIVNDVRFREESSDSEAFFQYQPRCRRKLTKLTKEGQYYK